MKIPETKSSQKLLVIVVGGTCVKIAGQWTKSAANDSLRPNNDGQEDGPFGERLHSTIGFEKLRLVIGLCTALCAAVNRRKRSGQHDRHQQASYPERQCILNIPKMEFPDVIYEQIPDGQVQRSP